VSPIAFRQVFEPMLLAEDGTVGRDSSAPEERASDRLPDSVARACDESRLDVQPHPVSSSSQTL
jgi:hypothetical protein